MKVIRLGKNDKFPTEPCDLVVCKAYPYTLSKEQLAHPTHGCINIHTSLLPKYRGRHPIVWAMINMEEEIGVTIHYMDEGIDTGDIILQERMSLNVNRTYASVKKDLDVMGEDMLRVVLQCMRNGEFNHTLQDESQASYYSRREPEDSEIPVLIDQKRLVAYINALSDPMPNAYMEHLDGSKVYYKGAVYEE